MKLVRPGVPTALKWLVVSALAGRFHSTAGHVVIAIAVQRWTGSFTSSGLVIAALVLGQAISSPLRGRAADRSAVRTLRVCALSYTLGLVTLAGLTQAAPPSARWVAAGVAFASGTLLPPVAPVLRAAIPRLTRDEAETHRTLAWEATYQELIFIGGPALALAVAAVTSPAAALALLALSAGVGATAFSIVLRRLHAGAMATHGPDRERRPDRTAHGTSRPAGVPAVGVAVLAAAYGLLLACLTALTLLAVRTAVGAGTPAMAGVLEALLAAGSMAGGAVAGRGLLDRLGLAGRMTAMALALAGLAGVCAAAPSLAAVGAALVLVGFWVAPSLSLHGVTVLRVSPPARRAETFGWINAVGLGLNASVTPLAGWVLDLRGAAALAGLAAIWMALGSALVAGVPTHRPKPPTSRNRRCAVSFRA